MSPPPRYSSGMWWETAATGARLRPPPGFDALSGGDQLETTYRPTTRELPIKEGSVVRRSQRTRVAHPGPARPAHAHRRSPPVL